MTERFVPLPGSERSPAPQARPAGALEGSERIEATLVLRRRAQVPRDLVEGPGTVTPAELADRFGADPQDVELVRRELGEYGVQVGDVHLGSRRVTVSGTVDAMQAAFGTRLEKAASPDPVTGADVEHRHRTGALQIPAELDGVVIAVLGLDNRPVARPHLRLAAEAARQISYTPPQLGEIYNFPPGTDGSGQTIAVIELGGGFSTTDLDAYFSSIGLATPSITAVGVDGGQNTPGQDPNGADGEVLLDIEVAGALAPGAKQVVYFAPNTDQGFVDAVSTAVHATPTPAAVSISWGGPEDSWTAQSRTVFDQALADAAALGVTVTVAAGDNGSADAVQDGKAHADFPASSPHALACGGTHLDADPATGTIRSETVWNGQGATGGGVSTVFPAPSYQTAADLLVHGKDLPSSGKPLWGRGVPDVAGDADPTTGYQVLVDGQKAVIGGTSAVAPLWAALVARLVQALGRPLGLVQSALYAGAKPGQAAPGFRDVTKGNNGDYSAAAGWDACTGLGSPDGAALLEALRGSSK